MALPTKNDIDIRYMPRKERRRGFASIEDYLNAIHERVESIKNIKERLIEIAFNSIGKVRTKRKNFENWKEENNHAVTLPARNPNMAKKKIN